MRRGAIVFNDGATIRPAGATIGHSGPQPHDIIEVWEIADAQQILEAAEEGDADLDAEDVNQEPPEEAKAEEPTAKAADPALRMNLKAQFKKAN